MAVLVVEQRVAAALVNLRVAEAEEALKRHADRHRSGINQTFLNSKLT